MSNIEPIDGRNARRAGSRAKLLKAGLRLIEKGDFRFSLQDVADRAQMHRRSIHDIFGDFDGYLHELVDEYEASIRAAKCWRHVDPRRRHPSRRRRARSATGRASTAP
jgi:AcrR family transcriptional regulator